MKTSHLSRTGHLTPPTLASIALAWSLLVVPPQNVNAQAIIAQATFRAPAVPAQATVARQLIDQGAAIEQRYYPPSANVETATPSSTFLPPASTRDSSTSNLQFGLSDDLGNGLSSQGSPPSMEEIPALSEEEFAARLRGVEVDSTPVADQLRGEPTLDDGKPGRETIRQRYSDGKTHVLRQVAQDKAGNYYNDGAWRAFSRKGEVIAEGQFERRQMVGQWRRFHNANSGGMFSTPPFNKYQGRFLSVASFVEGKLDGMWTIYDQNQQKIFEVAYASGKRDGTATWWFPTAQKMREATFRDGLLDGMVLEYDQQGKLTRREEYLKGQRVIRQVSLYRPKQPREVQFYLDGKLELDGEDQWWDAQPATFSSLGQRVQHGSIRRWYDNGQPKMQGQYKDDQRVGQFDWWHENGSRKLQASYRDGKKDGQWTWWHENGMKSVQGEYGDGDATGVWTWWDENGRVTRQEDFDKAKRKREGSIGELAVPDGDSATTTGSTDESGDSDSEADAPTTSDRNDESTEDSDASIETDSTIPLLLDTDALEEINPLEDMSDVPEGFFESE